MNLIELISKYALVYKIIIPKMTIIIIIIYYVILYIIFNTYNKRYLLLLILLLGIWKYHYVFDNNYYVYYLNVGQGDSSIVRYKNDVIMIDTGGKTTYKVDEWKKQKEYYYIDNSIKLLKSIGCDDIDLLILTHGDQDHLGESVHLINNFKVNSIKFNKGPYNNKEKEILNIINNKEVNIDIPFEYLDSNTIYDNENDNSVITLFKLYNYNLLYMGDASKKNELELINRYKLNIDILKVGHHGSNTSSDESFIKSIKPTYSIISVGKNNKYGHPNKEVLDILSNSNIYRTDIDGSIVFKINKTLSISTYPP